MNEFIFLRQKHTGKYNILHINASKKSPKARRMQDNPGQTSSPLAVLLLNPSGCIIVCLGGSRMRKGKATVVRDGTNEK
jgi:hypothetical protein